MLNFKTLKDLLFLKSQGLKNQLLGRNGEHLMYRVIPDMIMEVVEKYFRLEVEGLEHIPKKGGAVFTPNHSGYSGFDAVMLAHEIHKITGRTPRVLTHKLWFVTTATSIPMNKFGFV